MALILFKLIVIAGLGIAIVWLLVEAVRPFLEAMAVLI